MPVHPLHPQKPGVVCGDAGYTQAVCGMRGDVKLTLQRLVDLVSPAEHPEWRGAVGAVRYGGSQLVEVHAEAAVPGDQHGVLPSSHLGPHGGG